MNTKEKLGKQTPTTLFYRLKHETERPVQSIILTAFSADYRSQDVYTVARKGQVFKIQRKKTKKLYQKRDIGKNRLSFDLFIIPVPLLTYLVGYFPPAPGWIIEYEMMNEVYIIVKKDSAFAENSVCRILILAG